MTVSSFLEQFSKVEALDNTASNLQAPQSRVQWKGMVGSSKSVAAACVAKQIPSNHLFILDDKESAAYFLNDLEQLFMDENHIFFFPASYRTPYQLEEIDNANVVARAEVMEKINSTKHTWVVTYPEALFERVPTKKILSKNTLRVEKGKIYSIEFFNDLLQEYHFERVDFVYEPGQFAIRGGIVDVFSFSNDHPFRVEFFGDEVDTIRTFDPVSQLSINQHIHFTIVPNIQQQLIQNENGTFLEFIGNETVVWMSSYLSINLRLEKEFEKALNTFNNLPKSAVKPTIPSELYFHPNDFKEQLEKMRTVEFGSEFFFQTNNRYSFDFLPQPSFNKDFNLLTEDLVYRTKMGFTNLIFSNQSKQIERLYQIFEDIQSEVVFTSMPLALHEGFIAQSVKLLCYTDHQLFERYHRFKLKEGFQQAKQALTLKEIYSLQKGDYVTHIQHGIGQFAGLLTMDVNGSQQEVICLSYKDGDVLYVSIHSLHRISKFTGKDGAAPKMNKLGSNAWATLKQKTKKKIKELAYDLIQLYAQRKSQKGFAYNQDTYLQNELEASFMYEDTPDQLKATQAIKDDMEKATPMDRLICGDVGFGKTEVAMRAAFKAATDGKQVAILVPTTILCHQHFRSFKKRLENFPVTVDYINRFKSAKEITETLKKVETGKVDILVGTHKIVSDKVKFKDLGLIIIDEEQKFGVAVKDKLKTLKTTVDTLTLTATPIPRTLQFSLMGARDLSIISTPPPNRQPVLTEIIRFDEEQIRDAISYEVSRGGQVFFVHNRLANIKEMSGMIARLCPGVRVAIGHGQMDGKQLEKIMMDFIQGEYDVLLATTIIESGIDISNANTIIINDAQHFGLSDLHQLRGRVGRSNKKGFCYLIAPPQSLITSDARKRLEALVQFSDLGSGFNIAMKDLDIRGAGNLLGGEQSGFISEIGFEMYQKILNEAMDELKEEEFKELYSDRTTDSMGEHFVKDCVLETDFEIRIPDDYINNVSERLSIYQDLDSLKNKEELEAYKTQLIDRFGALPLVAKELMRSFELRWLAQDLGFEKLTIKQGMMIGYFISNPQSGYFDSDIFQKTLLYVQANPANVKMSEKNDKLRLSFSQIMHMEHALIKLQEMSLIVT